MCVKIDSRSVCWIPRPHRLSVVHNGEDSDAASVGEALWYSIMAGDCS